MVNITKIKEIFDFLHDVIVETTNESEEYYKAFDEQYNKLINELLEDN